MALRWTIALVFLIPIFLMPWQAIDRQTMRTAPLEFAPIWRAPASVGNQWVAFDLERLLSLYAGLSILLAITYLMTFDRQETSDEGLFDWGLRRALAIWSTVFSLHPHRDQLLAVMGIAGGLGFGAGLGWLYRINGPLCLAWSLPGAGVWGFLWPFLGGRGYLGVVRGGVLGGIVSNAISHTAIVGYFEGMALDKAIGCVFLGGVQGGTWGITLAMMVCCFHYLAFKLYRLKTRRVKA